MSNWTRAHDAWIARQCEGLDVWVNAGDGAICDFQDDSIPHYLTDPASAIRAAEAWRNDMPDHRGFWVGIDHCHDAGWEAEARDCSGERDKRYWQQVDTFPTALAQALYRATGGTA